MVCLLEIVFSSFFLSFFALTFSVRSLVMLLPMGRGDDGAHSVGEKIDRSNYIEGMKLMGEYLHECAVAN